MNSPDWLSDIDPVSFPPRSTDPDPGAGTAAAVGRRSFLKLAALAGGGFALALYLRGTPLAASEAATAQTGAATGDFVPNLFIRITSAGEIIVLASNPECGQGVKTALPMIIVEELDAPWNKVRIVQAGFDPRLGRQAAGGSRATPTHYEPFRKLGATARALLVRAAAARWNVSVAELSTPGDATVKHDASGRSASYGELARAAAGLPLPAEADVPVKDPKTFRLMGRRIGGVDNRAIVTGAPLFGIDIRRPGQLYAAFVKCPVHGGKVRTADLAGAKTAPGVRAAFVVDAAGVASGVAIVAATTWQAWSARDRLRVEWDEGRTAGDSSAGFAAAAEKAWSAGPGDRPPMRADGDLEAAAAVPGARVVEARYMYPFISHANLEPQNCTALFAEGKIELWAPSQAPQRGRDDVAKTLGLAPEAVTVHMTRMGGGFGRRLTNDFMVEAAVIAREVPGIPVQLVWTRADDMRHDWYRPAGFHSLRGVLDADGKLAGWSDHFVTFAVAGHVSNEVAGVATLRPDEFPSGLVPNCRITQVPLPHGIPLGPWRAPRASAQCFAQQSFLDELAQRAGKDPVAFRLAVLGEPRVIAAREKGAPPFDTGRMAGVVRLAAEKSGWGAPLPPGRGRGIAFQFSHLGYAAVVAEVTVTREGELTVNRVVVAADVGRQIINPSGAENQSEGSVVDGISTAWLQEITIEGGRTLQKGFDDMPLLRINQAPRRIETHFLITDHPPTGLGEPVIPPVPPAVANAIFAATGKRIRSLPFSRTDLSWS